MGGGVSILVVLLKKSIVIEEKLEIGFILLSSYYLMILKHKVRTHSQATQINLLKLAANL